MAPIDRPFRFTLDFCAVWVTLAICTFLITQHWKLNEPIWSYWCCVASISLFATFITYGPVLLARQIIGSGSRGRFVARVFFSVTVVQCLFFIALFIFQRGTELSWAWGCLAAFGSTLYLNWRLCKDEAAPKSNGDAD